MTRTACLALTLAAGAFLPLQSAGATVNLGGRISQIVSALQSSATFKPNGFSFAIKQGGTTTTLFSGVEGVRSFNDLGTLNSWAASQGNSPWGSSGYHFTHSVLGSYFDGDETQPQSSPYAGGGYHFTHEVLDSYFPTDASKTSYMAAAFQEAPVSVSLAVTAIPEPGSWGMMILGFALAGAALRRRGGVAQKA